MTTDLCSDDVVVCITSPQLISADGAAGAGAGAGSGASRAAASSAAVELGRRLLLAARAGNTALVLDLMAKGAPFTTDWLGTSPLHLAATNNHRETCAVLLRAGVSRDSRTKVERTPLHMAAYAGHDQVVALLLDHGAAVDCRDMLRMTPLHWAAARGHCAAAAALLARGAEPAPRTKFGKTPRQLAAAAGHAALLRLLDAHPAPPTTLGVSAAEQPAPAREPSPPPSFATIQRIQEIKPNIKPKIQQEKSTKQNEQKTESGAGAASAGGGDSSAAQLLRRHGITLLPADTGSTVLSALQAGRTVLLSDAGKLMLKESAAAAPPAPAPALKLYTINNKLLLPHKPKKDLNNVQVKLVQLGARRAATPVKIVVNKPAPPAVQAQAQTVAGESGGEAMLRAQLAAARKAIAALTAELASCKARLALLEARSH